MKVIIYTFKSFPLIKELGKDVFVFHKLKQDIVLFEELIKAKRPDFILGVARTKGQSRFEPLAINKFNRGRVMHGGPEFLQLYTPVSDFRIATKPTNSFCNWTMYKVQGMLLQKYPLTKHTFAHVNPKDVYKLKGLGF